jgi:hypothetical protein
MKSNIPVKYSKINTVDLPPFDDCHTIIQQTLWVLWLGKDKLKQARMTTEQISSILREAQEISVKPPSISQALKRAGDKVHCYRDNGQFLYEIMKPGKDYLMSIKLKGALEVFYVEPEQRYSSKRLLVTGILEPLIGELKIVDPYCGERTLDIFKAIKARPIKFLTKLSNITNINVKNTLLRDIKDFKSENHDIEIRDYPNKDLHDRYIISTISLILLGYSMKDLGAKESFAIVLNATTSKNIYESLSETFDKRWNLSNIV